MMGRGIREHLEIIGGVLGSEDIRKVKKCPENHRITSAGRDKSGLSPAPGLHRTTP